MIGPGRAERRDRGSMAIEMVLMTPVLIAFVLVVVAFGRFVAVRGNIEAASRDAVRAATFERTRSEAGLAAERTANVALKKWNCSATNLTGDFRAGQTLTITLSCDVPLNDLGLLGLPGHVTVRATSSAPLDLYRRTG